MDQADVTFLATIVFLGIAALAGLAIGLRRREGPIKTMKKFVSWVSWYLP